MSSTQRLQWLVQEIHLGRNTYVSFSFNELTQREKVKFVLESSYSCSGIYRPCVMGALLSAQAAIESSISTDKGHTSSDKRTIVEFWFKQFPGQGAQGNMVNKGDGGSLRAFTHPPSVDSAAVHNNISNARDTDSLGNSGVEAAPVGAAFDNTSASSADGISGTIAMLDAEIAKFVDMADQGRSSIEEFEKVRRDTLARAGLACSSTGQDVRQLKEDTDKFEVESHFNLLQKKSQLEAFEERLSQMGRYREQLTTLQERSEGMLPDEVSSAISMIFAGEVPDSDSKSPQKKKPRKVKPKKTGK